MRHNAPMAAKILVIDNYDSFVFNLVQYLQQLGAECTVVRNDAVAAAEAANYDGVLISPGPGTPEKAGVSVEMIKYCAQHTIPLFGVCLGHQAIGQFFGAELIKAAKPMHGKTSSITHNGHWLFKGMPSPFEVMRYHSLVIEENMPKSLHLLAKTNTREPMIISHENLPIIGVQFHPEKSHRFGVTLFRNFLEK